MAAAEPLVAEHDVVVVEGLVPGSGLVYAGRTNVALAKALDADVLLVGAPDGADDLEHLAETMEITARTYQGGERTPRRRRGRQPGPRPDRRSGPTRSGGLLARRDLALVGAVPFRPELGWPRVSDAVARPRRPGAQRGRAGPARQGRHRRRAGGAGHPAAAARGPAAHRAGGPRRDHPQRLPRRDERHPLRRAPAHPRRRAGPAGLGAVPAGAAATGLPVLLTERNSYETATTVHDMDPEVPGRRRRAGRPGDDRGGRRPRPGLAGHPADARPRAAAEPAGLPAPARDPGPRGRPPDRAARGHRAAHDPGRGGICHEMGIARCVLLGAPDEVAAQAEAQGLTLPPGLEVVDPAAVAERYVDALVEARRHKGMTPDIARNQLDDTITLGTMMLRLDEVDGMVAGAVHTTAATLRPALQLLGTAPGARAGLVGLLHVPARRGGDLRRLRGQPRPRRRAARRHRHPERRLGARVRHRAPGRDDQLQHRHVRGRAPTSSR